MEERIPMYRTGNEEGKKQQTIYSTKNIRVVPLKFDKVYDKGDYFLLKLEGDIIGTIQTKTLHPKLYSKLKSMAELELKDVSRN